MHSKINTHPVMFVCTLIHSQSHTHMHADTSVHRRTHTHTLFINTEISTIIYHKCDCDFSLMLVYQFLSVLIHDTLLTLVSDKFPQSWLSLHGLLPLLLIGFDHVPVHLVSVAKLWNWELHPQFQTRWHVSMLLPNAARKWCDTITHAISLKWKWLLWGGICIVVLLFIFFFEWKLQCTTAHVKVWQVYEVTLKCWCCTAAGLWVWWHFLYII